jgi:hypothetical protein
MDPEKESPLNSGDHPKVEGSHVEDLVVAESQDDTNFHLDRILDRKFDLRIVPWLFGIW